MKEANWKETSIQERTLHGQCTSHGMTPSPQSTPPTTDLPALLSGVLEHPTSRPHLCQQPLLQIPTTQTIPFPSTLTDTPSMVNSDVTSTEDRLFGAPGAPGLHDILVTTSS